MDQGIERLAGEVEDGIHGWGHMTLAAMTGRATWSIKWCFCQPRPSGMAVSKNEKLRIFFS